MNKFNKDYSGIAIFITIILIVGLTFGGLCLDAWTVMLLWNWVVPVLWIGAPTLTFWTSMGLTVLCTLLFKGIRYTGNKKQ